MILSHFLIVVFIPYECNENPTQGGGRKKERLERAERVTILISSNLEKLDCVLIFPICNTKLFPPLSNVSHRCVSYTNTSNRCNWDNGLTLKYRYAATCSLACMVRHLTPFGFHIYYLCYRLFRNPCFHDEERNRQQDFKIWEGVIAGRPEF